VIMSNLILESKLPAAEWRGIFKCKGFSSVEIRSLTPQQGCADCARYAFLIIH